MSVKPLLSPMPYRLFRLQSAMRIRHCHWTARGRLLPARLIFPLQYWHRRLCVWAVCVRESLGIEIAHDHVLQPFTTMPDTISESTVRHTVIAAVDAVAGDIQHAARQELDALPRDRKSTRLNSRHTVISYSVFCL